MGEWCNAAIGDTDYSEDSSYATWLPRQRCIRVEVRTRDDSRYTGLMGITQLRDA